MEESIEDFIISTELHFTEQYVQKRNDLDIEKCISSLRHHSPFTKLSGELISLSPGVVSDNSVNYDNDYEVGLAAMQKMKGCMKNAAIIINDDISVILQFNQLALLPGKSLNLTPNLYIINLANILL